MFIGRVTKTADRLVIGHSIMRVLFKGVSKDLGIKLGTRLHSLGQLESHDFVSKFG